MGIFLKSIIAYQIRHDLCSITDTYESVFIEIDKDVFHKPRNIVVGVIYHPPDTDLIQFNDDLGDLLEKLRLEIKCCYLLGDYNVNLLNYGKHDGTTCFVDILQAHSFVSLISRPTRVSKSFATLIDNIFTNSYSDIENTFQCLIYTDITDHYPIVHIDFNIQVCDPDTVVIQRNFSQRNRQQFYESVASLDWQSVKSETDAQRVFSSFHSLLIKLFHKHFPNRNIRTRYTNRKSWLTQGLKDAIKTKNKLYHKYHQVKSAANEEIYKRYRNKLNHILRFAEKEHYSDLLRNCQDNIKKTWNTMKNIINKNKSRQKQSKFRLSDGTFTTDGQLISNTINEFFINIGPNLAKKIPGQNMSPVDFMGDPLVNSIFLSQVTHAEISTILNTLKNGAPGYDEINACLLKQISHCIVDPLTHVCNLSFSEGIFPDELKLANVIPLYKADDVFAFNNYRPVSLQCILSKVFEKVMYNRLIDFLETYKIIVKFQFGFRKLHSTYMALMTLMDKLITALENGEHVIGIFLDFPKTFDTVDHEILLKKDVPLWYQRNSIQMVSELLVKPKAVCNL